MTFVASLFGCALLSQAAAPQSVATDFGSDVSASGVEITPDGLLGEGFQAAASEGLHIAASQSAQTWSVEFWLRCNSASMEAVLGPNYAGLFQAGTPRAGEPVVRVGLPPSANEGFTAHARSAKLTPDEWHHVAMIVDGAVTGTSRLVIDGKPIWRAMGDAPEVGQEMLAVDWARAALVAAKGSDVEFDELRFFERILTTAEVRRHMAAQVGETQEPALKTQTLTTESDWAAGQFTHAIPSAKGVDWSLGQWTQDEPEPGPHARTCHSLVNLGDGRLLIFGGELRDTHAGRQANGDDTWLYHLADSRWERVAQNGEHPAPRCHIGMAMDPVSGKAFLLGGWFNSSLVDRVFEDVWFFDRATETWQQQALETPVPGVSDVEPIFHQRLGQFMFLNFATWLMEPATGALEFGGNSVVVDELQQPVDHGVPTQAMTWYDSTLDLVVRFGGIWPRSKSAPQAGESLGKDADWAERMTNALHVFFPEQHAWVYRATSENGPSARVRGGVAYDTVRKQAVLFGGITGGLNSRANDLWSYDIVKNEWQELHAANPPSPRGGYFSMAFDEPRNEFILPFGRQDKMTFLDEVWRLRLRPEARAQATWRFDVAGWNPALGLAWKCTGEASVNLRSSNDGSIWSAWRSVQQGDAVIDGSAGLLEVRVDMEPGSSLTQFGFE